ncbi:MAG: hypothetical protein H7Z75_05335 [Ferruginibacter sp.]|nr:hypothetical protein [Cytophagales bacterium]
MAQDYDKIFREVFKDIFPVVAQKLLGILDGHYQPFRWICSTPPSGKPTNAGK